MDKISELKIEVYNLREKMLFYSEQIRQIQASITKKVNQIRETEYRNVQNITKIKSKIHDKKKL